MRKVCWLLLAMLPGLSLAQGAPQPLVFGINEGVTYRISASEVRERFKEIADDLSKLLKRPVRIEYMDEYVQMGKDLEAVRYDLAYVHPAHYAIRAIDKAHYRLVAVTKGYTEYRASFLVRGDATYGSLADPRIKQIGMPDADSITAWIVRATLHDALGAKARALRLRYTRYQDAVPFMLDYGFAEVGATAAGAVIKEYTDKGGKVLLKSKPVPIKELIASPNLPAPDLAHIQQYFLNLEATEEGQKRLTKLGYKGFASFDERQLVELGRWLDTAPADWR
jgi:ABC-type phosphate/phosphonate transport system substrate-binding protein